MRCNTDFTINLLNLYVSQAQERSWKKWPVNMGHGCTRSRNAPEIQPTSLRKLSCGLPLVFQQNNTKLHSACIQQHGSVVKEEKKSIDLTPAENIWHNMKLKMHMGHKKCILLITNVCVQCKRCQICNYIF